MPILDIPVDCCERLHLKLGEILQDFEDPDFSLLLQSLESACPPISGAPLLRLDRTKKRRFEEAEESTAISSGHGRKVRRLKRRSEVGYTRNDGRKRGSRINPAEDTEVEIPFAIQEMEGEENHPEGTISNLSQENSDEWNHTGETSSSISELIFSTQEQVESVLPPPRERVRKDKNKTWEIVDDIQPLTIPAANVLQSLASIGEQANFQLLLRLMDKLSRETPEPPHLEANTLELIIKKCSDDDVKLAENKFKQMVSLIQLSLWLDHFKTLQCSKSMAALARQCGVSATYLRNKASDGTRLLYISLCGSPYLLVLIALFEQKHKICKTLLIQDLSCLGGYLRQVPDNHHGKLIKSVIIPVISMMNREFQYYTCSVTLPESAALKSIDFWDLKACDKVLGKMKLNYYMPCSRSSCWDQTQPIVSSTISSNPSHYLPVETLRLKYPFKLKKRRCPVEPNTTVAWTAAQREKAQQAIEITNLADLTEYIRDTPLKDMKPYVAFDTNLLEKQTLLLQDEDNKFGLLLITHMPQTIPEFWNYFGLRIQALFSNEFKNDHSDRADYDYLAIHYHWYNRYAERGTNAPIHVHPDHLRKANVQKVNLRQRTAHESKEICEDTEEFELLRSIMDDLMAFIQANLEYQIPDIYEELSLYCKVLPLNANSPAFPFSGLVINISVSTNAHRDHTDKTICVVVPFGDWVGGEICLYELGLVVKLKAGDILVFRSCDITHFNLHFSGQRGSLVLHSDRQGDYWVEDFNGWVRHIGQCP